MTLTNNLPICWLYASLARVYGSGGGGLGVSYHQDQEILNLQHVKNEIDKCYTDVPYKLSFEPGRYLIANSGIRQEINLFSTKKLKIIFTNAYTPCLKFNLYALLTTLQDLALQR